jgi:inhibitor of cysteine peptidase
LLAVLLSACSGGADQPVDSTTPTTPTTGPVEIPDDAGPVFVETTDILLMESFPVQVALHVTGNLPTPCHQTAWELEDDGNTIAVRLASITEPDVLCAQVLEPFDISIPLGEFESGTRVVTLNGAEIGDFEI